MPKDILNELKAIKDILTHIVGTSNLSKEEQFSKVHLDKAAKEFKNLSIERGEWVEDSKIDKIIRDAPYRCGAFIQKEFGFTNVLKHGRTTFYNRKDLLALSRELKERNINLTRFYEYRQDQDRFTKAVEATKKKTKGQAKFKVPAGLKDIVTTSVLPDVELIHADIRRLEDQFVEEGLERYIDIYSGNHAMMKFEYHFDRYIDPGLKKKCRKWCEDFNYAHRAFSLVTPILKI